MEGHLTAGPPAAPRSHHRLPLLLLPGLLVILSGACFVVRPSFGPIPPVVRSLEGYASWRLVRDDASARSRLSFLFVLPDRGLIEIHDPLNRTVSRLFLEGGSAYLVIPGKRAYWEAPRREVMGKLLGFDLSVEELSGLLSGRDRQLTGWTLQTDDRSRVTGGHRDDLTFLVRRFFEHGRLPEMIDLSNGTDRGSLRVIRLRFNQATKEDAFRLAFLSDDRYRAVSWAEVEEWLRHED
jgi:outer membrane biogenesis lipoprotein LolB